MKTVHSTSLLPAALGAALSLLGTAAPAMVAPDTTVAEVTLRLNDLRYRLEDLDPSDGITPWMTLDRIPPLQLTALRAVWSGQAMSEGAFGPVDPVELKAPDGKVLASRSGDDIMTTASMRVDNMAELQRAPLAATWEVARVSDFGVWQFTLSPRTRLVIEADPDITHSLDPASLLGDPRLPGDSAPYASVKTGWSAAAGLSLSGDWHGGTWTSFAWADAMEAAEVDRKGWRMLPPDFTPTGSFDQPLSVHVDNIQASVGHVEFRPQVKSHAFMMPHDVAAVPEPQAAWLVAAGLALVAVRRKRGWPAA